LNPDLIGNWSHFPALPFLPQVLTSTIMILNPSANPFCSSLRDLSIILIFLARRFPSRYSLADHAALYQVHPRPQSRIHDGKIVPLPETISSVIKTSTRTTFQQASRGLLPQCLSVTHFQTCRPRCCVMATHYPILVETMPPCARHAKET